MSMLSSALSGRQAHPADALADSHARAGPELLASLDSDPTAGLTAHEAEARLRLLVIGDHRLEERRPADIALQIHRLDQPVDLCVRVRRGDLHAQARRALAAHRRSHSGGVPDMHQVGAVWPTDGAGPCCARGGHGYVAPPCPGDKSLFLSQLFVNVVESFD